ncbi:hypothetical protein [Ovoidimarina sediminis]|uniref:hypothetical protein n=1 Tax=Ovoidimarina sediminis TaxID=3079856 RepID=UPI0029120EF7|nr:hypothetical protein [Rhodophyticola sp. MJ-SS7]MDU8944549.1 hypothetical protein [Rhodophyticola sp. MJ-SS7]
MANRAAALVIALGLPVAALAEAPQPGEDAARLVGQVSEALFDLLPTEDHANARAFFTPEFAELLSEEEWNGLRKSLLAEAGAIPRYRAHALSFYPQADQLIAAVDFSGPGENGTAICGYLVWSMPTDDRIGLLRIEESVANPALMRQMQPEEATQALLSWRCPPDVIASVLGLPKAE